MKPAPFDYHLAADLAEACRFLADGSDEEEVKVIAGGQTLVPLMAMRLARPARLVDLNGIEMLAGIQDRGEEVEIGAMTRQRDAERSNVVTDKVPLLAKALPFIGHIQTRTRGTVGGSIVHGDPSSEIPLVAMVLGARLIVASAGGERETDAGAFFEGPMMTAIEPDEILAAVRFPVWHGGEGIGASFHEVAPRHGDFAIVSAAVQVAVDAAGVCRQARIGVGGCGLTPLRLRDAEAAVEGQSLDGATFDAAVNTVADSVDPEGTVHAGADYRRRLAGELVRRALADAAAEAAS